MEQILTKISSAVLIIFMSGCSTFFQPLSHSSNVLKVNSTELGNYWLVKSKTLDWSAFLRNNQKSSFAATFTINSDGQIEHLYLKKITGEFKPDEKMYEDFSKQTFIATYSNYRHQPVTVTMKIN
ncbi:hypothetical protein HQQ94_20850 [Shewanella sp. VB17]|uniref:hypothetical protein n=1 Tax=Shewanella sp. VB17 TaxID=2739432 RepID=UPI001562EC59|nr:hypothetical protein [Shewanella sp. VB17]NRD75624.1 hypothetical protein [Shewanella sp. VB17]